MVDVKGILANCGTIAIYETADPQWDKYRKNGKYYIAHYRYSEGRVECMYLKDEKDIKILIDTIEIAVNYNKDHPDYYDTIQLPNDDLILFSKGYGDELVGIYLSGMYGNESRGKYIIKQNGYPSMYLKDNIALDSLYVALKSVALSDNISLKAVPPKVYDRFADLDYAV
jgi:hypothetical protein